MGNRRTPRHTRSEAGISLDQRPARIGLGVTITVSVVGLLMLGRTAPGMEVAAAVRGVFSFFSGVIALVSLTVTVALGLLSADRIVLPVLGRIRSQLAHRATAMAGMGFLAIHVTMKIIESRTSLPSVVIPLSASGQGLYVGFGAIASDLMILVFLTGVARARFAENSRPWLWRMLHGSAYLAWPMAVLHGLTAGRAPAEWVTWSYVVCLVAVGAALLIRVISELQPKPIFVPEEAPVAVPAAVPVAAPVGMETTSPTSLTPPTSIVGRIPRIVREEQPELRRIGDVG
ncbi:hypothetical protein ABT352_20880 [Streptosporangium sp. NPDC000563]|uniref:hypothetical protein n=1 Tax=unclassified Streptosporangium TaxID=2632669 RepID=UPI0033288656